MPHLCCQTDAMRNTLLPYASAIYRCFRQGMTVAQCAAFLYATEETLRSLAHAELDSPAGHRAIREVLWMREAEKPEPLLRLLLNLDGGSSESKRNAARIFAEGHPGFMTWVPAAYQSQVDAALGLQTA